MDINNINYLTFEGGGGKGTIYLGAVQGLEEVFNRTYSNKGKESK